jgi:malonyl-CoA/methylmalonyl-CoA synthetase
VVSDVSAERLALVGPEGQWTYAELDAASARVAGGLLAGASDLEEARVAFLVAPGLTHAAVQRGAWRAGGVAVPLALSHPPAELDYVLRDAGVSVAVAGEGYEATLAPVAEAAGVRFARAADLLAATPAASLPHLGGGRRALIIYTSGTTGRPKGAVSTHANIGAQVGALVEAWGWTPGDRLLHILPMHHIHGIINGLGSALAVGAVCEFPGGFDATAVWTRLASGEVTVFTAVPTVYHKLLAAWDVADEVTRRRWAEGARGLRLMMSGSAALPASIFDRWREITGHTLLERYGMTETGMILSNPLDGERRRGFVGAPLPEVEVRLVDETGAAMTDGGPGEIEVRGPAVFREYWGRPEATAGSFREGWFRTGDVAVIEEGSYRLLGRRSVDIVKTGGYKVSALEIEEVLREHPAVNDCAVVGVDDPEWGERVSAAVELCAGQALTLPDLQTWMKERLAPYKVPRALEVVAALPRNAMGKVVKPDVAKLFEGASR